MVEYLGSRGMWDEPAFGLSGNERAYVEAVPKEEAKRMLRQVGFWAGVTAEMSISVAEARQAASGTLSSAVADGERVGTGHLIANGYTDGLKTRDTLTEYGLEGGLK